MERELCGKGSALLMRNTPKGVLGSTPRRSATHIYTTWGCSPKAETGRLKRLQCEFDPHHPYHLAEGSTSSAGGTYIPLWRQISVHGPGQHRRSLP